MSKKLKNYVDGIIEPSQPNSSYPLTDNSLPSLILLEDAGYTHVRWLTNDMACPKCRRMNGRVWKLHNFLRQTRYEAPIFSKSHVNDRCSLLVFRQPNDVDFPPVLVNYTGIYEYL